MNTSNYQFWFVVGSQFLYGPQTLAEVEKDISSMLVEAANIYDENEHALQLRAMHAVNDGMRDSGSMVVVPSSLGDSFGNAADFLKRL